MSFPIGAAATLEDLATDPHPLLARLRAAEPVSWLPALNGWLVTRHDLAQRVLREPELFTVDDPRFSTARVVGPSMLSLDGTEHARHRDPFTSPFRPAEVRDRFAGLVTAAAELLADQLAPAGAAELRAEFAGPLALAAVAAAIGLTGVDTATVRSWYAAIVESVHEVTAGREPTAGGAAAVAELRAAVAGSGPAGLTEAEATSNAAVLMFGGIDTTEGMIVNLVRHLLLAGVSVTANAVEESLRLEPAAAVVDRYATGDVELAGARVLAGELVVVSLAGANRDPAVFAAPDRFDPDRANVRLHLSFAQGPHFCLGARLARMEAETAARVLLARLPGLRIDPPTEHEPRGLVFRRPPRLHVRW